MLIRTELISWFGAFIQDLLEHQLSNWIDWVSIFTNINGCHEDNFWCNCSSTCRKDPRGQAAVQESQGEEAKEQLHKGFTIEAFLCEEHIPHTDVAKLNMCWLRTFQVMITVHLAFWRQKSNPIKNDMSSTQWDHIITLKSITEIGQYVNCFLVDSVDS